MMINIRDLHFQNEILPLFDYVNNEFSRYSLRLLASEMPDSVGEIYYRQQIIKGMLQNESLYAPFSYSKFEFNQVYGYVNEKKAQSQSLQGIALAIHFLFASSEYNREKSGLSQFFIFLDRLNDFYFLRLNPAGFPEAFQERLKNIQRMIVDLDIAKNQVIARRRGFTMGETIRLMSDLEKKIRSGEMDEFWKDFFLFEAYFSISKGIKKHGFVFPEFNDQTLSITEFYHPLLQDPVKNSLMAKTNLMLITGPNMSGKSTLLKSVGLCVYLAHLGWAVPAGKCVLPFFDTVSVAINLNDDLKNGYSHFMAEIQALKSVVVEARSKKKCFAVFDELFRGTNNEDALAISQTTILGLTAFPGCYFFISTHLHQLRQAMEMQTNKISTGYLDCDLDQAMPAFTYRLRAGWSDLKIGQIIFEQEGLNALLAKNDNQLP
jgi:DNA mismatch repair protein MutS